MAHLKESGDSFKDGFLILGFSLSSDSQAAVKKTGGNPTGGEISLNSVSAGENRTPPTRGEEERAGGKTGSGGGVWWASGGKNTHTSPFIEEVRS